MSMPPDSSEEFTLGRGLDLKFTSNKIVIILALAIIPISFGWFWSTGHDLIGSLFSSIIQSILLFLCWAIARELDPDHDYAAFLGIPILFIPLIFMPGNLQGNILVILWFLLGLRLINQTTGRSCSSTDVVFFMILTLVAAFFSDAILLVPLAVFIIFLAAFLPKKQLGLTFLSLPLFPSFILLFLITPDAWIFLNPSPLILIYIAMSSALLFLVTTTTDTITCKGDHSFSILSVKRVQSAQLICVLSVLMLTTFHGSLFFLFPVWAAITGVGIYRLILLIIK